MARPTPPAKNRKSAKKPFRRRNAIPLKTRYDVLTQAGFRCSVPRCNHMLSHALDMHHLDHVAEGGGDTPDNLLALCPNHHVLYHRGDIPEEALRVYKGMQVALFEGFGKQARDQLLFLSLDQEHAHIYTSDATLQFVPLVVAGLVELKKAVALSADQQWMRYKAITDRGKAVVDAWKRGDEEAWLEAQKMGDAPQGES
jgi:hypothetical protein